MSAPSLPVRPEPQSRTRFNLGATLDKALQNGERIERQAVFAAFCVYLLFQINAAFHHGSWGQDLETHTHTIKVAVADPWYFFWRFSPLLPDPPLYFLIVAAIYKITGGIHWREVTALFSIAINAAGLYLLYKAVLRRLIRDRLLRISSIFFLLFLPVLMIHATVLASDAPTVPMVIAIETLLLGLSETQSARVFWLRVTSVALLLIGGIETKLIFESQALAAVLSLWILGRTRVLGSGRVIKAAVIWGSITVLGFVMLIAREKTIGFEIKGGHMSVRDVIFFHAVDLHVLSAPQYDEPLPKSPPVRVDKTDIPVNLLIAHRFSYPALLHLAIFTDIMNIYQYDPTDSYFGQRSRTNRSRMRVAVKTGLIFFFAVLILTPVVMSRSLYLSFVRRRSQCAPLAILSLSALGWYLNVVLFLPLVPAYFGGYWTPRLVTPALVLFVVLSATAIDKFVRLRSRAWPVSILLLVCFQSLVQLSFLWPWGLMRNS